MWCWTSKAPFKTRLIPALGELGAARLAYKMLLATIEEALSADLESRSSCATPNLQDPAWQDLLPTVQLHLTDQGEGDLGERLGRATRCALLLADQVLLLGTDCPELTRTHLRAAAATLDECDAVLHPARDGGYVLLGVRRFDPSLFGSMRTVAHATLERSASLDWTVHDGETLVDVDEPEDLDLVGALL